MSHQRDIDAKDASARPSAESTAQASTLQDYSGRSLTLTKEQLVKIGFAEEENPLYAGLKRAIAIP